MALNTITFEEYINLGYSLPMVFNEVDDTIQEICGNTLTNFFFLKYCDREIAFETTELFRRKLELYADMYVNEFMKRINENETISNLSTQIVARGDNTNKIYNNPNYDNIGSETKPSMINHNHSDNDTITNNSISISEKLMLRQYLLPQIETLLLKFNKLFF